METKEDRIKRLRSAGIETNELIDKQFIKNENVSSCVREVQILMDKWNLRPLERDILIMLLGKYEKERQLAKKQKEFMDNSIGGILNRFGLK